MADEPDTSTSTSTSTHATSTSTNTNSPCQSATECINAGHEGPCYLSKYRHSPETHFLLNRKLTKNCDQRVSSSWCQDRIEHFMTTPIDTYLQTMSQNGTYADHICLQAISKRLHAEIRIVHADSDDVLLPTDTSTCSLVLGYLPEMKHYVSVQPFLRFENEDFVAVLLSQKRRRCLYIAKVVEIDGDDVKLRFLQSSTSEGVYTWPNKDDTSWQPNTDVITKLKPPQLVQGRGLRLKFDLHQIKQCHKKL